MGAAASLPPPLPPPPTWLPSCHQHSKQLNIPQHDPACLWRHWLVSHKLGALPVCRAGVGREGAAARAGPVPPLQ